MITCKKAALTTKKLQALAMFNSTTIRNQVGSQLVNLVHTTNTIVYANATRSHLPMHRLEHTLDEALALVSAVCASRRLPHCGMSAHEPVAM